MIRPFHFHLHDSPVLLFFFRLGGKLHAILGKPCNTHDCVYVEIQICEHIIIDIKEGTFLNVRQLSAYFRTTKGLRTKPCKRKTVVLEEFENYVLIGTYHIDGTYMYDSKRLETFVVISPSRSTIEWSITRACMCFA